MRKCGALFITIVRLSLIRTFKLVARAKPRYHVGITVIALAITMFVLVNTTKYLKFTDRLNDSELTDGLTVVTAYFQLQNFEKGNNGPVRNAQHYVDWATVFARLESPTIIFVDSDEYREYFSELRSLHLPANISVIQVVQRQQLLPLIRKLFSCPGYPYHTPNTVEPEYAAAVNAKYELLQRAILSNPFKTRYFSWLDMGYFRELAESGVNGSRFSLALPPDLDSTAVAYGQIFPRKPELSPSEIFSRNVEWLCGGFFIGRIDVLYTLTEEHKRATKQLLEDGWMGADQQVIYSMFNAMNPQTKLQLYIPDDSYSYDRWFYLGYLAVEAANKTRTAR